MLYQLSYAGMRSYLSPRRGKGKARAEQTQRPRVDRRQGRPTLWKSECDRLRLDIGGGMMPRHLGSAFSLAATLAVAPALAQEPGNAEAGHDLASKLCASCHIVGNERRGSDLAPPFPVIAKDPDTSLIELHAWIGPAHPMLPHLALTSKQIADINAYLDSLRGVAPAEPAPPPSERELPQAPPDRIGPPIGDGEEPD
jgi:mono/diheme cytochrome c family protein